MCVLSVLLTGARAYRRLTVRDQASIVLLQIGQRGRINALGGVAGHAPPAQRLLQLPQEGEAALDAAVSRVEPALVLLCSVLVGLILLSVMLPLMHIMSAIG